MGDLDVGAGGGEGAVEHGPGDADKLQVFTFKAACEADIGIDIFDAKVGLDGFVCQKVEAEFHDLKNVALAHDLIEESGDELRLAADAEEV